MTPKDSDSARSAGQWTPGPWEVYDSHTGDYHIGKADEEIAEVFAGPTAEADARLIAAAPALLEAAIRLLEVNDRVADDVARATRAGDAYRLSVAGADEFTETLEPLRAAIALATHPEGQTPFANQIGKE